MFREWLGGFCYAKEFDARRSELLGRLHELRGKDLACFCALGSECHADVLLELVSGLPHD